MNWACNMLCPVNANATDKFLRDNLTTIREEASKLLKAINYKPKPIYRGVILKEQITALQPHPNFTYLSFSERKNIAYNFADLSDDGFPCINDLGEYGYVVEYLPRQEEVLYHYDFPCIFPIVQTLEAAGMDNSAEVMIVQKEVAILQPAEPMTNVKPFAPYPGYKSYEYLMNLVNQNL